MKEKAVESLEELRTTLKRWQEIEDASVAHTTALMERTKNPLIRLVMEIIRQDSVMHKRVQQVILDSLEQQAFTLTPEELADIWEARRVGEGDDRSGREGPAQLPVVRATPSADLFDRGRAETRSADGTTGRLQARDLPVRIGLELCRSSKKSRNPSSRQ
jgi:hypothetical protein